MRRTISFSLLLIFVLAGWSVVAAEDGFYVISGIKRNYAPVPKTGQTITYSSKDDGDLEKGISAPTQRFTDNGNGTITDRFTGLIWMKNANVFGQRTWDQAMDDANNLASGPGGLTDVSQAGDWRLPNLKELQSLADYGKIQPALPAGHPFSGVLSTYYWTSTTHGLYTDAAWTVAFGDGYIYTDYKTASYYVWCVKGGP